MLSLITKQNRLAKLAFLLWVLVRCGAVLVQTRMAWPDRKVALRIPARSARDIPVAGRFALRAMPSAFQYLCGFYKAKTPDALRAMPSAFQYLCGLYKTKIRMLVGHAMPSASAPAPA